eukprot:Phypoly_transcript_16427.p1 GENE.Phypoly_transcript_16427~~Phypoly_transcript_16427.p1  ORF type:complete len:259 (+),score=26.45 Phypoly_transcript_16427:54-830(+)
MGVLAFCNYIFDMEPHDNIIRVRSRTLRNNPDVPKKTIRIVCVSDTHDLHHTIEFPPGDILIHCGDFTSHGNIAIVRRFAKFIEKLDYKHKFLVPGNHEICPDMISAFLPSKCHYLRNDAIEAEGIKIYGARFKPNTYLLPLGRDSIAQSKWAHIPDETDILITHQPATGFGDITYSGKARGNEELLKRIQKVKPALHLFGHNHEAWGLFPGRDEFRPNSEDHPLYNTTFVGCASKVGGAEKTRPAIVIEFEMPENRM